MLVEATAPIGRGDRFVADLVHAVPTPAVLVVNKADVVAAATVARAARRSRRRSSGEFDAYVPLSAPHR